MFRIFINAALAIVMATPAYSMDDASVIDGRVVRATEGVAFTAIGGILSIDLDNASAVQAACKAIMQTSSLTEEQLINLAARLEAHIKIDKLSPGELKNKRDCYLVDAMPDNEFCSKVREINVVMDTWTARTEDPDTTKINADLDEIGLTLESWKRVWKRLTRSIPGYIEKNPADPRIARYKKLRVAERLAETMPVEMLGSLPAITVTINPALDIDSLHGDNVHSICEKVLAQHSLCPAEFVKLVTKFEENGKIA